MSSAVVWLVGGVGVLLLYAAYKRQSPVAMVGAVLGGKVGPAIPPSTGSRKV